MLYSISIIGQSSQPSESFDSYRSQQFFNPSDLSIPYTTSFVRSPILACSTLEGSRLATPYVWGLIACLSILWAAAATINASCITGPNVLFHLPLLSPPPCQVGCLRQAAPSMVDGLGVLEWLRLCDEHGDACIPSWLCQCCSSFSWIYFILK